MSWCLQLKKETLDLDEIKQALARIRDVRVCVLGDVCLDLYWFADMRKSLLSRETPHFPLPIVGERYSPGGAGNVMANVKALGVKELIPISVMGCDWRGFLLKKSFAERGISTESILETEELLTPTYCKPFRKGISDTEYEDPRLDFENFIPLCERDEEQIIGSLREVSKRVDVIAVSDQYMNGVVTPRVRQTLAELGKSGVRIVVDSRDRVLEFEHVLVKPNEVESARAVGLDMSALQVTAENYASVAQKLFEKNGTPAIVTLGSKGALWADAAGVSYAATKKAKPPIDIVGAGDTFLSAFCCAYAAGLTGGKALAFANLASGVTVKKIGTTGTASPEEILQKYGENYA